MRVKVEPTAPRLNGSVLTCAAQWPPSPVSRHDATTPDGTTPRRGGAGPGRVQHLNAHRGLPCACAWKRSRSAREQPGDRPERDGVGRIRRRRALYLLTGGGLIGVGPRSARHARERRTTPLSVAYHHVDWRSTASPALLQRDFRSLRDQSNEALPPVPSDQTRRPQVPLVGLPFASASSPCAHPRARGPARRPGSRKRPRSPSQRAWRWNPMCQSLPHSRDMACFRAKRRTPDALADTYFGSGHPLRTHARNQSHRRRRRSKPSLG